MRKDCKTQIREFMRKIKNNFIPLKIADIIKDKERPWDHSILKETKDMKIHHQKKIIAKKNIIKKLVKLCLQMT